MTPLAGVVSGLDHTDSLLNIQADGTIFKNSRVTITPFDNSSPITDHASLLVDIDLTGITAGAGARLSFDLLGFGDRNSTITVDNVLLTDGTPTAAPVAVNDSYTVAEGATSLVPLASGLLQNDTDTDTPQAGLSVTLATGPLQGTLTVNADGSFTYVHNGSETTTDAFTYRVSDGINVSNLATVSLTIAPVNDAPVIAAIAPQTANRGATLTFTAVATDPDLPLQPLAFSLAAGAPTGAAIDPVSGVFTWAVPVAQPLGATTVTVRVTDAGAPALFAERTVSIDVQPLLNQAPVLAPIGAKSINEQTELRFTISATDADLPAQTLTYSATGLPAGATFDAITREFAWTPTEAQGPGLYNGHVPCHRWGGDDERAGDHHGGRSECGAGASADHQSDDQCRIAPDLRGDSHRSGSTRPASRLAPRVGRVSTPRVACSPGPRPWRRRRTRTASRSM